MNWKSRLLLGVLLLSLAGLPVSSKQKGKISYSDAHSNSPYVMTGLTAIRVHVVPEDDGLIGGLRTDSLQEEVEQQLRAGGIKVLTETQWQKTVGHPTLLIHADVNKVDTSDGTLDGRPVNMYHLDLSLHEDVLLPPTYLPDGSQHQTMVLSAILWRRYLDGVLLPSQWPERLRLQAKQMIDAFLIDYRKASLKPKQVR